MLLPLFQALENSAIGTAIRDSLWLFPVVEVFHLIGLAVIGGAILVVDFRLLGLGLRGHPVSRLARDVQPWVIGSLIADDRVGRAAVSVRSDQVLLQLRVLDEDDRVAAGGHLHVHRPSIGAVRARRALRAGVVPAVALTSIALWSTVGWGGRWIGFS